VQRAAVKSGLRQRRDSVPVADVYGSPAIDEERGGIGVVMMHGPQERAAAIALDFVEIGIFPDKSRDFGPLALLGGVGNGGGLGGHGTYCEQQSCDSDGIRLHHVPCQSITSET